MLDKLLLRNKHLVMQKEKSSISENSNKIYYLPNFLGLGSQRCASTWLYYALNSHPNILMTSKKETRYFSHKITTKSLEWYSNLFDIKDKLTVDKPYILGEIDPSYAAMYYQEVLLVKKIIPHLKIILIIRHPVERIVSSITRSWSFSFLEKEKPKNKNIFYLLRIVDSSLCYRFTNYERTYKNWSSVFGVENIFIETYDNINLKPKKILNDLILFLGLENSNLLADDVVSKRKNVSKVEEKEDIPNLLKWYLSRKWLPKIYRLQSQLNLDLSPWIESMEKNVSGGKWYYYLIIWIHQIYFLIPYTIAYKVYDAIRLPLKIYKIRRNLDSQISTS